VRPADPPVPDHARAASRPDGTGSGAGTVGTDRGSHAATALVVGLGSVDRGDDGVGPTVADLVAAAVGGFDDVRVVVHEDPTALVDLMAGHSAVVLVDAARSGAPPGTVTVHRLGPDSPALAARTDPGAAGTHGLGLAGALELARVLDRLPPRVSVVGIEAAGFEHGADLSPAVAGAVPDAVAAVLTCLAEA
jgi:hydrogenase maturation protease